MFYLCFGTRGREAAESARLSLRRHLQVLLRRHDVHLPRSGSSRRQTNVNGGLALSPRPVGELQRHFSGSAAADASAGSGTEDKGSQERFPRCRGPASRCYGDATTADGRKSRFFVLVCASSPGTTVPPSEFKSSVDFRPNLIFKCILELRRTDQIPGETGLLVTELFFLL